MNRHQLLRKQNIVAIVLKRLAIRLFLHLRRPVERRLHRAELLDQVHGPLISNSRRTRDVVDRVPTQRHHIDHPLRRHPQRRLHSRRIEDQVVLHRVQDRHIRIHQLHHVFVARNHEHLVPLRRQLAAQRADHIVRLEAPIVENRNPKRLKRPPDIRLLLDQVRRRLRPVGLVAAVLDRLERLRLDVELLHVLHLRGHLVAVHRRAHVVHRGHVQR